MAGLAPAEPSMETRIGLGGLAGGDGQARLMEHRRKGFLQAGGAPVTAAATTSGRFSSACPAHCAPRRAGPGERQPGAGGGRRRKPRRASSEPASQGLGGDPARPCGRATAWRAGRWLVIWRPRGGKTPAQRNGGASSAALSGLLPTPPGPDRLVVPASFLRRWPSSAWSRWPGR